jgi:molecular chaperone DnaK (HSP70)
MRPVILRNTTIPCRKIQTCRALVPADGQLRFAIFEGERPLTSDNSRLGELTLSLPHLVPAAPPNHRSLPGRSSANLGGQANAEVPMEVTFELDANGILHVLVLEKMTATRERLVITNDKVALLTTIFLGLRCSVLFCSVLTYALVFPYAPVKGRLSAAEIERMVREAEAAKTADDELRRIIEAQCGRGSPCNSLEGAC